jgi:hypothetical protein
MVIVRTGRRTPAVADAHVLDSSIGLPSLDMVRRAGLVLLRFIERPPLGELLDKPGFRS